MEGKKMRTLEVEVPSTASRQTSINIQCSPLSGFVFGPEDLEIPSRRPWFHNMMQHEITALEMKCKGGRCLRCGAAPAGGREKSAVEVLQIRFDL